MQISYEWLSEYLPIKIEVEQLSEILTTIGLEVENIELKESIKGSLKGVFIGEVIECEPHPNADRLRKTLVKINENDLLPIVCGAPNVAKGQKVVVATAGTTLYPKNLPEGLTLKATKIRGEKSEGMICAEDELGLGESHDGIMVLDHSAVVGTPAADYFQLPEPQIIFHIGLTPNRSDAMSHLGVASDVLAYWNYHNKTNYKLNFQLNNSLEYADIDKPTIILDNLEICKRFASLVIDKVQVGKSPEWLKNRLESIGIRSVNNIVDVSNYVLHEMGQPIHIYDYNTIHESTLHVKNVPTGTEFITLNQQQIKLNAEDIVIADNEKVLGLAGVMGGKTSSVNESTTKVLIESASFHPKWIRRTSIRHQMRTDAAVHFEKSTSIDKVDKALLRTADLLLQIAGGKITSYLNDIYPEKIEKKTVEFSYSYIRKICGKNYEENDIDSILLNLGIEIADKKDDKCTVLIPYHKTDIFQAADIAEEILRIDGLNNVEIGNTIRFSIQTKKQSDRKFYNKISDHLSHNGFREILTNSIVNSQHYQVENIVRMMNSLSSELDAMRPELCRSGLEVIEYNLNRGSKNLFFYEIGNVYHRKENDFVQSPMLSIWCTGLLQPKQWMSAEVKVDIYWLKGILQNLWTFLGIKKYTIAEDGNKLVYKIGADEIASITILSKKELNKIGIKQDVFYAEVHLKHLSKYTNTSTKYKPLNKFPSVDRDLSIIINKDKKFVEIDKVNSKIKAPILKSISVFDLYEGESIGKNNKSWSMNYIFHADDRTLTDTEVDEVMNTIMELYQKELQAEIRK